MFLLPIAIGKIWYTTWSKYNKFIKIYTDSALNEADVGIQIQTLIILL